MSRLTKPSPLVEMQAPPSTRSIQRPPTGFVANAGSLIDDEPAPATQKKSASGPSLREKLSGAFSSGGAKIGLIVLCLAALGFGAFRFYGEAAGPGPQWPRKRVMNPDSGELRWFQMAPGAKVPDGFYPVEYCFFNECGPAGGTPVVLNLSLGKSDQTKCPKCGHEVVGHNPRPTEYEGVQPSDWR